MKKDRTYLSMSILKLFLLFIIVNITIKSICFLESFLGGGVYFISFYLKCHDERVL